MTQLTVRNGLNKAPGGNLKDKTSECEEFLLEF